MEEYEIEILETAVELRNIIETNFTTQPSKELLQNGFTIDFLEGNVFYNHLSLEINPNTRVKQENLYHISKTFALQTEWSIGSKPFHIWEIGFNAGHSLMILIYGALASQTKLPIQCTIFDIGEHSYTQPCFQFLQKKFEAENVSCHFIKGDSIETMKQIENVSYDIIHIDGSHLIECIKNDMKNADRLSHSGSILIIDDTEQPHISQYVDLYLQTGRYKELCFKETNLHRILQKI